MNYKDALARAEEIKRLLEPYCHRIEIAGSIRRKKPDNIKDIELVAILDYTKLFAFKDFMQKMITVKGKITGKYIQFMYNTTSVDLFITTPECWGCIFFIRTGSAEFSKRVVTSAHSRLLKFYDGRLWDIDTHTGEPVSPRYTPEERDVFRELGMTYIEPEMRN